MNSIEESNDLSLDTIISEYPLECIPSKLKTPTGEKAKRAKYEEIDTNLYGVKANMVAFRVKVNRIMLWIKTLHIYYYDYLGNTIDHDVNWFDEPSEWSKNSGGNKAIVIEISTKDTCTTVKSLLYKITFFINTGIIQAQGNAKDKFAQF